MAKQPAQNWFDTNINKITITAIKKHGTIGATEKLNPAATAGNELNGPLKISGCKDLESIDLGENEITELIIEDCPKLKKIHFDENKKGGASGIKKIDISKIKLSSGKAAENDLQELFLGKNDLTELDLTYCKKLEKLRVQDNPNLDKLPGLDELRKLKELNNNGDNKIAPVHTDKIDYWRGNTDVIRELAGIDSKDPLPSNKDELKDKIKAGVNNQLKDERDQARSEAKTAKDELGGVKTERDQLKQQWEAIRAELGLANNASQQQIIDKIKELNGRPTSADHSALKTEKDNLQTEKDRLEKENKENKDKGGKEVITRKVLAETTNTNLEGLGITLSDEQKSKINQASSASEVQKLGNEIIKSEFSKLQDESGSSFKLSVGLGVLTIGSLLILGWVLLRQSNLPQTEPEKEKE